MNTLEASGRDGAIEVASTELGRSDKLLAGGLATLALVIYLATPLQVHNQIIDFSNFAAAVQRIGVSDKWFYGDHLVYVFLLNWLYHSLVYVCPHLEAVSTAQAFNSIVAGLGVGAFYLLARVFVREQWVAAGLALTLLFSYEYWLFATDVEVHAPAASFYIISLLFAFRISPERHVSAYVALGAISGIAVLFHVITVLFVALIAALIFVRTSANANTRMGATDRRGARLIAYGGATAACVTIPYWYVAERLFHLTSWREIYLWLFPNFGEGTNVGAASLISAIMLAGRRIPLSIFGRLMWIATPAVRLMPGPSCLDASLFMVRNVPLAAAVLIVSCGVAACALLACLGMIGIRDWGRIVQKGSVNEVVLIGWLVGYGGLIGVFMPGSSEHWGMYWLPGLLLLVGQGLSATIERLKKRRRLVRRLGGAMLLLLIVGNGGNVAVQTSAGNDLYLQRLAWYRANVSTADLVIDGGDWMWSGYTEYYLESRVVHLRTWMTHTENENRLQSLEDLMLQTREEGGRVFVTADALMRDACSEKITEDESAFFESFKAAVEPRISCIHTVDTPICEILD